MEQPAELSRLLEEIGKVGGDPQHPEVIEVAELMLRQRAGEALAKEQEEAVGKLARQCVFIID
jgi:hypothetical protein